jgi:hypothetical protein
MDTTRATKISTAVSAPDLLHADLASDLLPADLVPKLSTDGSVQNLLPADSAAPNLPTNDSLLKQVNSQIYQTIDITIGVVIRQFIWRLLVRRLWRNPTDPKLAEEQNRRITHAINAFDIFYIGAFHKEGLHHRKYSQMQQLLINSLFGYYPTLKNWYAHRNTQPK